jgi:uncharacterized membrane protein YhaH (DUF805 family)
MAEAWHYADGDKAVGPVGLDELRRVLATHPRARDLLVWHSGLQNWRPAGEMPELAPYLAAPPPTLGPGPSTIADARTAAPPAGAPSFAHIWFSFAGRANRAKWWLVGLVNVAILVVLALLAFANGSMATWVVFAIIAIVAAVSGLAIGAKRLHDRNKSAWWLLVFYVLPNVLSAIGNVVGSGAAIAGGLASLAISIWAIVELGCLRGTPGPNPYGPDPLA